MGGNQDQARLPGKMLVGDDALGGFYAVNGGGSEGTRGNVFDLAPDTLSWEDLECGYSDWVHWACIGDFDKFYENVRWPDWEKEVSALEGNQGISISLSLWAEGPPVADRSRQPVPIEELWGLHAKVG